jgi:tetratricopeptide (TPR) repeat protein
MMKLLFMMTLFRLTTVILVFGLASANWAQEPINGPWLWMFAPVAEGQPGGAQALDTDQIATLSQGKLTETLVAKQGVAERDSIGLQVWKSAVIEKIQHSDNIGLIASKIGIGSPQFVTQRIRSLGTDAMALDNFSAYAFAKIVSDFDQPNVTMRVGSDDAIKVWFNGEVVHQNAVNRASYGFQDTFEIDLKAGANNLLIKVAQFTREWSLSAGIQAKFTIGNKSYQPISEGESLKWFDPAVLVEIGQVEIATANYERLIQTNSVSNTNLGFELSNLTSLYQQQDLQREGINFLESMADEKGKSVHVWPHLVMLYKAINDQAGLAKIQQQLAAASDPQDFDAGMSYGQILMETEMFDQATSVYEKLFTNFPDRPYMLWGLQHAYQQSGGTEKAIEGFENLLESHPNHTELLSQIIQLYRETNNPQKIITIRDRLLSDFNPQDFDVTNTDRGILYGELLSEDGRHQEAQKIYEALVEAHPNEIFFKQHLIQSYRFSNQTERVKSVLDQMLAQIGKGSDKDNPSLVAFCVEILIDLEKFEEARARIEKLSDVWPEHPGPMELMAKLYDAMGQTDKANEYRVMSDPGQKLVGLTAANFQLADLDGNQVSLSQFVGQPVILNFWATW